jgi:hypothetical protein
MLYVDLISKKISGTCKVSDIKKYGLLKASIEFENERN